MSISHTAVQKARLILDLTAIILLVGLAWQVTVSMADMIARGDEYGMKNGHYVHIDFLDVYSVGHLLQSERRNKLYDPDTQLDFYNQSIAPVKVTQCFYVQTPPHYLLFTAPLSFFTIENALLVWNTFSVLAAFAGIFLLCKTNKKLNAWAALVITSGTLASLPSADSLMNGQAAWFFLAVFTFFAYAFIAKKDSLAAVALMLSTFKPHYFLLLVIPSLIAARQKMLIRASLSLLASLFITSLFVGWQNVILYPKILMMAEGKNNFAGLFPEKMVCLRGILSLFLSRETALHVSLVAYAGGLVAITYLFYLAIIRRTITTQWAFALATLIMLVTSPHLHVYDCALVAFSVALTLPTVRLTEAFMLKSLSLRIWTLTLFAYPILTWFFMLMAPGVGSMFLPSSLQVALTTNGQNCGLLSFYCYLANHLLMILIGTSCALVRKNSAEL